ncbi:hypothetical protein JXA63_00795 [Candidatus Woesebacteria bacterium]|nr:hypothetical protein [Candidatus Woesebacteria bacterium]
MGERYNGYPLLFTEDPEPEIVELNQREDEVLYERFEGNDVLSWKVEGVHPGRNPLVLGRFHDEEGRFDGYYHVKVLDGKPKEILVSPDKMTKRE